MKITLRSLVFVLAASLTGFCAQAREIDNEKTVTTEQIQLGRDLPKTLVVRVKAGTNETAVMHANSALAADESSKSMVSTSSFIKLDSKGRMMGELDRDSSSSSWYFWYGGYYPRYYYYGYNYSYYNYYSYYYGGYNYYYYGWPYYNPYCRW